MDISAQLDRLTEQRATAVSAAETIINAAASEERELTSDQLTQVEGHQERAEAIDTQIRSLERQLNLAGGQRDNRGNGGGEGGLGDPGGEGRGTPDDGELRFNVGDQQLTLREFNREQRDGIESLAFRGYLMAGYRALPAQLQTVMDTFAQDLPDGQNLRALQAEADSYGIDLRVLQTGSDAAGGYIVPEGFYRKLSAAEKNFNALERAGATVFTTDTAEPIPMPTHDDTGNVGEIIAETGGTASEQDTTFGSKTMDALMFSSKIVRLSIKLAKSSAFDLEGMLAGMLGERIGRIFAQYTTSGNGTTQPEGFVTAANTGKTSAANTAVTYDELVDLVESIDDAYAAEVMRFMWNQSTLTALRKLKDSDGRPIWEPAGQGRAATILGHEYIVNPFMDSYGSENKPIAFGAFRHYHIRNVGRPTLFRFDESYMGSLQIGYMAYQLKDGLFLDPAATAAQSPAKVLAMPT